MKKTILVVFVLLSFTLVSNAQNPPVENSSTLFERLGGTEGITLIVDEVIQAHANNPVIQARFTPYLEQPENLAVIRQHTIDFFSAGSGANLVYTGKDMATTHLGMNISAEEYMAVMDDIMLVLDERNIDQTSKMEVLAILWSLKGMIMHQ
jgi:hemoglobin